MPRLYITCRGACLRQLLGPQAAPREVPLNPLELPRGLPLRLAQPPGQLGNVPIDRGQRMDPGGKLDWKLQQSLPEPRLLLAPLK